MHRSLEEISHDQYHLPVYNVLDCPSCEPRTAFKSPLHHALRQATARSSFEEDIYSDEIELDSIYKVYWHTWFEDLVDRNLLMAAVIIRLQRLSQLLYANPTNLLLSCRRL